MNDLIISKQSLPPATIDELQEWIIVNKECLNAHKAKIRAIQKMNMAIAAKEAAIQDGQYLGDILLDAEVRLGEMLEKIQPEPIIESSPDGTINKAPLRGRKPTLPPGITKKQSHEAQEIARNPEAVEKTKQEARAEGRLPTSRDVLAKIRRKKPPKPIEPKISEEFKLAYEGMLREIKNAKALKWKTTSKRAALKYVGILKDVIII